MNIKSLVNLHRETNAQKEGLLYQNIDLTEMYLVNNY